MTTRTSAVKAALVALLCLLPPGGAGAVSIWELATERHKDVYRDDTARYVGDLLTIRINESAEMDRGTRREATKETTRAAAMNGTMTVGDVIGGFIKHIRGRIWDLPTIAANSTSTTELTGEVDVEADRTLTDTITVTVEDVLPNGNLLVIGKRMKTVLGETQILQVSGVVRPSDIAYANTVQSTQVADFHMVWMTQSPEKTYTNPGWMTAIANFINPF